MSYCIRFQPVASAVAEGVPHCAICSSFPLPLVPFLSSSRPSAVFHFFLPLLWFGHHTPVGCLLCIGWCAGRGGGGGCGQNRRGSDLRSLQGHGGWRRGGVSKRPHRYMKMSAGVTRAGSLLNIQANVLNGPSGGL